MAFELLKPHADYIVKEYENGQTTYSLATEFGCSQTLIQDFLNKNGACMRRGAILYRDHRKCVVCREPVTCTCPIHRPPLYMCQKHGEYHFRIVHGR